MMKTHARRKLLGLALALASTIPSGCGGDSGKPAEQAMKEQTQGKLDAMKQLAEAIEKNDPQQTSGSVEALVSSSMDVKTYPDTAREIIDIYMKRVKGKLKPEAAASVKSVIDEMEKAMK